MPNKQAIGTKHGVNSISLLTVFFLCPSSKMCDALLFHWLLHANSNKGSSTYTWPKCAFCRGVLAEKRAFVFHIQLTRRNFEIAIIQAML